MATEHKYKGIAIGLACAAGVFAVLAIFQGYAATKRFFANSSLNRYSDSHFQRDIRGMRKAATDAASWLGTDARSVLPAIDPQAADADDRLAMLEKQVSPAQRHLVITARNFARAIKDQDLENSDQMRGSNATLINHIVALRTQNHTQLPPLPELDSFAPPDFYILHRCLEERVRVAWNTQDHQSILESMAALRFYDKQHPFYPVTEAFTTLYTLDLEPNRLKNYIQKPFRAMKDDQLKALRRAVMLIANDHDDLDDYRHRVLPLLEMIPTAERTPQESSLWMQTAGSSLDDLVASAQKSNDQAIIITAINRCFSMNRNDLALELAQKLDEKTQKQIRLAVAARTWDLATIQELAPNPHAYMPTVKRAHLEGNTITFHIASPSGTIPDTALRILVNDLPVANQDQERLASLISIPVPADATSAQLAVSVGDVEIFNGKVD